MYIDIHTHNQQELTDVLSIKNIRMGQPDNPNPDHGWFSAGVHPWDSHLPYQDREVLVKQVKHPNNLAIGECGLDHLRGADPGTQLAWFTFQVQLAETLKKPVIIHCVQAWQELIALKKKIQPEVPWIIHGFRGKSELAEQLVLKGFYISFGEILLSSDHPPVASLQKVPANRLFLETDTSQVSISTIYQAAAQIKGLSLADLQQQMTQNFTLVFGTYVTP